MQKYTGEKAYLQYAEEDPIDNEEIWHCYQALRRSVGHLSHAEQIAILECAAALANAQEKAAFLAALRLNRKE